MKALLIDLRNHKLRYLMNIMMAILFLIPFLWIVSTSLKNASDIAKYPPEWIPKNLTFENYKSILTLQDGAVIGYFLNSAVLTIITIFLVTLIGGLAGYGFSKLRIPLKNIILMLIMVTLMIPFHGLLIPLFSIMKNMNLLGTHTALVIIYVTFHLPFAVFMLKNSFDALPDSLREAAMIDGYSEFQTFFKIALPLIWPGIATVAIYTAYTTWNDFLIALVFANTNDLKTLNVGLTNLAVGQYGTNWGLLSAGSILSFIPIILLFFFLQRYFISGLTSGSVK